MILDSSAVVALLLKEASWEVLFDKLTFSSAPGIGTPTLSEAGIVLTARTRTDARATLARFMQEFGVVAVPFGEPHWLKAVEAYLRFGKGRHSAALNFGDCMAYATARLAQRPLLCVGGDFPQTDLDLA